MSSVKSNKIVQCIENVAKIPSCTNMWPEATQWIKIIQDIIQLPNKLKEIAEYEYNRSLALIKWKSALDNHILLNTTGIFGYELRNKKSSAVINSANGHIDVIGSLDIEAETSAHQTFSI